MTELQSKGIRFIRIRVRPVDLTSTVCPPAAISPSARLRSDVRSSLIDHRVAVVSNVRYVIPEHRRLRPTSLRSRILECQLCQVAKVCLYPRCLHLSALDERPILKRLRCNHVDQTSIVVSGTPAFHVHGTTDRLDRSSIFIHGGASEGEAVEVEVPKPPRHPKRDTPPQSDQLHVREDPHPAQGLCAGATRLKNRGMVSRSGFVLLPSGPTSSLPLSCPFKRFTPASADSVHEFIQSLLRILNYSSIDRSSPSEI